MMRRVVKIAVGLFASLVLFLSGFILLNWAPDRPVETLKARWAPPPSTFLSVRGQSVHLRDEGPRDDATPIVLLHGTSASLHTWDGWAAELSKTRRVIRFDLPGFGLTGPSVDGRYTIASYVALVVGVLDSLGVERVVLAGNSLGGNIAWETAVAHPARIERLVLVDASGYPRTSISVPIGFRIATTPVLNQVGRVTLPRRLVESSVRNVYGDPSRVTPELVDRYYELTLREGNRASLVERFRQSVPGEHAEDIKKVAAPTLILWGGQDRLIPQEHASWFQRDIARNELVVFDDLGHVPQEEDPARSLAALVRFLGREAVQECW